MSGLEKMLTFANTPTVGREKQEHTTGSDKKTDVTLFY